MLTKEEYTNEELLHFKTHSQMGADALEEVYGLCGDNEFIRMAVNIAKYHHENWNGSGYPTGLAGNEIPLCARIVSILEIYDSLVCFSQNGNTVTHEEAMRIINRDAGIVYDPDIIDVFNKIQSQLKRS